MRFVPHALIGFVLAASMTPVAISFLIANPPPAPQFLPPKAITVTLYPSQELRIAAADCVPVDISTEKLDHVFRRLTPEKFFGHGVHEHITCVVAEATITHVNGSQSHVIIRDHGHNPAVVSVNGRDYFYARNDPDVYAGGFEFQMMILDLVRCKAANTEMKP